MGKCNHRLHKGFWTSNQYMCYIKCSEPSLFSKVIYIIKFTLFNPSIFAIQLEEIFLFEKPVVKD